VLDETINCRKFQLTSVKGNTHRSESLFF